MPVSQLEHISLLDQRPIQEIRIAIDGISASGELTASQLENIDIVRGHLSGVDSINADTSLTIGQKEAKIAEIMPRLSTAADTLSDTLPRASGPEFSDIDRLGIAAEHTKVEGLDFKRFNSANLEEAAVMAQGVEKSTQQTVRNFGNTAEYLFGESDPRVANYRNNPNRENLEVLRDAFGEERVKAEETIARLQPEKTSNEISRSDRSLYLEAERVAARTSGPVVIPEIGDRDVLAKAAAMHEVKIASESGLRVLEPATAELAKPYTARDGVAEGYAERKTQIDSLNQQLEYKTGSGKAVVYEFDTKANASVFAESGIGATSSNGDKPVMDVVTKGTFTKGAYVVVTFPDGQTMYNQHGIDGGERPVGATNTFRIDPRPLNEANIKSQRAYLGEEAGKVINDYEVTAQRESLWGEHEEQGNRIEAQHDARRLEQGEAEARLKFEKAGLSDTQLGRIDEGVVSRAASNATGLKAQDFINTGMGSRELADIAKTVKSPEIANALARHAKSFNPNKGNSSDISLGLLAGAAHSERTVDIVGSFIEEQRASNGGEIDSDVARLAEQLIVKNVKGSVATATLTTLPRFAAQINRVSDLAPFVAKVNDAAYIYSAADHIEGIRETDVETLRTLNEVLERSPTAEAFEKNLKFVVENAATTTSQIRRDVATDRVLAQLDEKIQNSPVAERTTIKNYAMTGDVDGIPRYIVVHRSEMERTAQALDAHIKDIYKPIPFEVYNFTSDGVELSAIRSADKGFYMGAGEIGVLNGQGIKFQIVDAEPTAFFGNGIENIKKNAAALIPDAQPKVASAATPPVDPTGKRPSGAGFESRQIGAGGEPYDPAMAHQLAAREAEVEASRAVTPTPAGQNRTENALKTAAVSIKPVPGSTNHDVQFSVGSKEQALAITRELEIPYKSINGGQNYEFTVTIPKNQADAKLASNGNTYRANPESLTAIYNVVNRQDSSFVPIDKAAPAQSAAKPAATSYSADPTGRRPGVGFESRGSGAEGLPQYDPAMERNLQARAAEVEVSKAAPVQAATPEAINPRAGWTTYQPHGPIVSAPERLYHIDFPEGTSRDGAIKYLAENNFKGINFESQISAHKTDSGKLRVSTSSIGGQEELAEMITRLPADVAGEEVKTNAARSWEKSPNYTAPAPVATSETAKVAKLEAAPRSFGGQGDASVRAGGASAEAPRVANPRMVRGMGSVGMGMSAYAIVMRLQEGSYFKNAPTQDVKDHANRGMGSDVAGLAFDTAAVLSVRLGAARALGTVGIGLAVYAGYEDYKAAEAAGNGEMAARAIGGTAGGLTFGMAGMAVGGLLSLTPLAPIAIPVTGLLAVSGGFAGGYAGSELGNDLFGDRLQKEWDTERRGEINDNIWDMNTMLASTKLASGESAESANELIQVTESFVQATLEHAKSPTAGSLNRLTEAQLKLEQFESDLPAMTPEQVAANDTALEGAKQLYAKEAGLYNAKVGQYNAKLADATKAFEETGDEQEFQREQSSLATEYRDFFQNRGDNILALEGIIENRSKAAMSHTTNEFLNEQAQDHRYAYSIASLTHKGEDLTEKEVAELTDATEQLGDRMASLNTVKQLSDSGDLTLSNRDIPTIYHPDDRIMVGDKVLSEPLMWKTTGEFKEQVISDVELYGQIFKSDEERQGFISEKVQESKIPDFFGKQEPVVIKPENYQAMIDAVGSHRASQIQVLTDEGSVVDYTDDEIAIIHGIARPEDTKLSEGSDFRDFADSRSTVMDEVQVAEAERTAEREQAESYSGPFGDKIRDLDESIAKTPEQKLQDIAEYGTTSNIEIAKIKSEQARTELLSKALGIEPDAKTAELSKKVKEATDGISEENKVSTNDKTLPDVPEEASKPVAQNEVETNPDRGVA